MPRIYKTTDLSGQIFTNWIVLYMMPRSPNDRVSFMCRCKCGKEFKVDGQDLKRGKSTQCQACSAHRLKPRLTHGQSNKSFTAYKTWESMKGRCLNPNSTSYKNYGGRGITICHRWVESFENFLEDMGQRPVDKTIDRIDVNGNYEPGNCRWATLVEQAANKRKK